MCDNLKIEEQKNAEELADKLEKCDNTNATKFENALKEYLGDLNGELAANWRMEYQEEMGRCMIANREIQQNELIFIDKPLAIGPRVVSVKRPFCVCCFKFLNSKLTLCLNSCKFPVCEECAVSEKHKSECELIRKWQLKNGQKSAKNLLRALTVIRSLLVSEQEKEVLRLMESHELTIEEIQEIETIVNEFEQLTPTCEIVQELKRNSSVFNTNAFEVNVTKELDESVSLRGLYPVAAAMNHCCVPNVRYVFRSDNQMAIYAARKIQKDEQIFNTYTKFLFGTPQRRLHLAYSKKFMCNCYRCLDPTECGTFMCGIKCIRPNCLSVMLPVDPLKVNSLWKCHQCDSKLDHGRVTRIHDIFSEQIFSKIYNENVDSINQYLKNKLLLIVPETNQFVIEVKMQIILKMKQKRTKMSIEDVQDVEKYCQDVLNVIDKLGAGDCFVKGTLCYELITVKLRLLEVRTEQKDQEHQDIQRLLENSWTILGNTISEPNDLKKLLEEFAT